MGDNTKEIRMQLSTDIHKDLKKIALDRDITLKQLIIDILGNYGTVPQKCIRK